MGDHFSLRRLRFWDRVGGEGGAESRLNPKDLVTPSQLATPPAFFYLKHGVAVMYLHSGRPPCIHITAPPPPYSKRGIRFTALLAPQCEISIVESIELLVQPVTSPPSPRVSQLHVESVFSGLDGQCMTVRLFHGLIDKGKSMPKNFSHKPFTVLHPTPTP